MRKKPVYKKKICKACLKDFIPTGAKQVYCTECTPKRVELFRRPIEVLNFDTDDLPWGY